MRMDIHTHAWHARVAPGAVQALENFFDLHCTGSGALEDLIREEDAAGMDAFAVLCCADRPQLVHAVNSYALSLAAKSPKLVPFGTAHPQDPDFAGELDRLERHGIGGIKLHPDYQGYALGDTSLLDPLFEALRGRFCVLIHVGSHRDPAAAPSTPRALLKLARRHPGLDIIGAHFGGFYMWDEALEVLGGSSCENLWLDTSSTAALAQGPLLRRLLGMLPKERLLFGSDWPIGHVDGEMQLLQRAGGLTDGQLEQLLGNAADLLHHFFPDFARKSLPQRA